MPYSSRLLRKVKLEEAPPLALTIRHSFDEVKSCQHLSDNKHTSMDAHLEKAQEQSIEILSHAHAEAERIISESLARAEAEAKEIARQASVQGFQEGHQEGHQKGYQEAISAASAEAEAIRQEAKNVLLQARNIFQETIEAMEMRIVDLAGEIAEKVISTQLTLEPEIVVALARDVLSPLKNTPWVTIFVNPGEAEHHESHREEYIRILPPNTVLNIISDAGIGPGGCRVETENGEIDAALDTRWNALLSILHGCEEHNQP